MLISGKSCIYGIFGDPVSHSLSPLLQNRAFQKFGIDAVYVPFRVSKADLPAAVDGIRSLNLSGVNITIPHKENILPLLDAIDPPAKIIGAVNTVVNDGGVLTGYNTDSTGFYRALQAELTFQPEGKKVLLLGAGGACRSAVFALATAGVSSIVIANRHLERAARLVSEFSSHFDTVELRAVCYADEDYLKLVPTADLIVNTTALGLRGERIKFLPLENIKCSALIYDMIYSPTETPLIRDVCLAGFSCTDGLGMLAAQGEDAFRLWTGVTLPVGYMRKVLSHKE